MHNLRPRQLLLRLRPPPFAGRDLCNLNWKAGLAHQVELEPREEAECVDLNTLQDDELNDDDDCDGVDGGQDGGPGGRGRQGPQVAGNTPALLTPDIEPLSGDHSRCRTA